MPLILSKCWENGSHNWDSHSWDSNNYGDSGSVVESKYGDLVGLYQGTGSWSILEGNEWLIIEVEEKDIIQNIKGVCRFVKGKVLYRGKFNLVQHMYFGEKKLMNEEGLHPYAKVMALDSHSAIQWAELIGDREIMRDRITDSNAALYWAKKFGDREIMIKYINEPEDAYFWARNWPADRDKVRKFVTTSEYAFYWAKNIGDVTTMYPLIKEPEWALSWAREKSLGYRREMFDIVCRSDHYYNLWVQHKLPIFRDPQCWQDQVEREQREKKHWQKFYSTMNENERRIYHEQCDEMYRKYDD
jgi:hypothetical protein